MKFPREGRRVAHEKKTREKYSTFNPKNLTFAIFRIQYTDDKKNLINILAAAVWKFFTSLIQFLADLGYFSLASVLAILEQFLCFFQCFFNLWLDIPQFN